MMCQRANEIQSNWNTFRGDFFTTSHSYCGKCQSECMCKDCCGMTNIYIISGRFDYHESIGGTRWYFGGGNCVRGYGNSANSTSCFVMNRDGISDEDEDYQMSSIKEMVWLPRQDQLQELFWSGLSKTEQVRRFLQYLDTEAEYNQSTDSLESLWLSLYMKEKHNKKWNRISNVKRWEEIR